MCLSDGEAVLPIEIDLEGYVLALRLMAFSKKPLLRPPGLVSLSLLSCVLLGCLRTNSQVKNILDDRRAEIKLDGKKSIATKVKSFL